MQGKEPDRESATPSLEIESLRAEPEAYPLEGSEGRTMLRDQAAEAGQPLEVGARRKRVDASKEAMEARRTYAQLWWTYTTVTGCLADFGICNWEVILRDCVRFMVSGC